MFQEEVGANGWTCTPADAQVIFGQHSYINEPAALSLDDIKFPAEDPIVAKSVDYVKARLHSETFNHSMRVYYYGMAITKQQFPERYAAINPSSWALVCLFHDIGTAEENLDATRMSFDIYGGIKALSILPGLGATKDQAEATAEAIIRHEDMGVDGTITFFGQLIQLATTYDNTSIHPRIKDFDKIVHEATRRVVVEAHPRLAWSSFFSSKVRQEEALKPWCHTTHLVDFAKEIEANTIMKIYE